MTALAGRRSRTAPTYSVLPVATERRHWLLLSRPNTTCLPRRQRGNAQPLRRGSGARSRGSISVPRRARRRRRGHGGSGKCRRSNFRQQRIVRGVRRGSPESGVPRRQDQHLLADAPGSPRRTCRSGADRALPERVRGGSTGCAGQQRPVRDERPGGGARSSAAIGPGALSESSRSPSAVHVRPSGCSIGRINTVWLRAPDSR